MAWGTSSGEHFLASNPPSLKSNFGVYNVVTDCGADPTGAADSRAPIAVVQSAAGAAQFFFPPQSNGSLATYKWTADALHVKSSQSFVAIPGTATIQQTTASKNILDNSPVGALSKVTVFGLMFDCTNVGWSAIAFQGSDAAGQISDITIRDCQFKNPSSTWMVQINYTIADPTIPASKNTNIRIEDCKDDASGQTFTLENFIFVNCQDVVVQGCRLLNAPASLAAHVGIYAYCRNVRLLNNYVENFLSSYGVYVIQSDAVQIIGDNFRTTANNVCVQVYNSQGVTGQLGTWITGSTGIGMTIRDFSGGTFDGHTNLYAQSSSIRLQGVNLSGMAFCFKLQADQIQGQTDLFVEGNICAPLRGIVLVTGIPASPSATIKRINVRGNHVSSHSGFTGSGCVSINGNASAPNGGLQTIEIADNFIPASGAGSGTDIEVVGLADDVSIHDNHCMSPAATSIQVASTVTNLRQWGNYPSQGLGVPNVLASAYLNAQTAAVASLATATVQNDSPTRHAYRVGGSITITTLGSGNINLQVTYSDTSNQARTKNIPLVPTSGVAAASATTADDWTGFLEIMAFPGTTITLKTAGTFTGCTYNASGQIEQVS